MPQPTRYVPGELASMSEAELRRWIKKYGERQGPRDHYPEAMVVGDRLVGGMKHISKSDLVDGTNRLKQERRAFQAQVDWNLKPLKKRTTSQRVESMALRLWGAIQKQPWEAEMLVRTIQSEYWKEGIPRTYDQCKLAAQVLIRRAEQKQKGGKR